MAKSHYDDPDFARRYAQGPVAFVPGYEHMQRMAAQLIRERVGSAGEVLVLGAGGGLELEAFSSRYPQHHGYIHDAPPGPFDAATCLLTLHFVPDDGAKERTLTEVHRRLKPGAPFVLVDLCIDLASPQSAIALSRYRHFALESGAEPERVDETCGRLTTVLQMVSAERNEELLQDSGFTQLELFYAAHSWRGWSARA